MILWIYQRSKKTVEHRCDSVPNGKQNSWSNYEELDIGHSREDCTDQNIVNKD